METKPFVFADRLREAIDAKGSLLCAGLDSDWEKIPAIVKENSGIDHPDIDQDAARRRAIQAFNMNSIIATSQYVCAYKSNIAFYEAQGEVGIAALRTTVKFIRNLAPHALVILDAKRADIGSTNLAYLQMLDDIGADAITVNPYFGQVAMQPFLDRKDKGIIVLCRTSNQGSDEFQGLNVSVPYEELEYLQSVKASPWSFGPGMPSTTSMCNHVAYRVSKHWNGNGNCALVVGATYPAQLESIRRIVGDMPILMPGIGKQGGDVKQAVKAGVDKDGAALIVNVSSDIIFASSGGDFAQAAGAKAKYYRDLINQYR